MFFDQQHDECPKSGGGIFVSDLAKLSLPLAQALCVINPLFLFVLFFQYHDFFLFYTLNLSNLFAVPHLKSRNKILYFMMEHISPASRQWCLSCFTFMPIIFRIIISNNIYSLARLLACIILLLFLSEA